VTLVAERIKLATTWSSWWSAGIAAVLSLGFAAIPPLPAGPGSLVEPERAAIGVTMFAVPVLMILAATTVTGEYRTGMIRTTFLATPNRTRVLGAKALLLAAVAGLFAAALVIAAIALANARASGPVAARLSLSGAGAWRQAGAIGLYAALGAVLAVGLGALLRHAAGVVAVLLLSQFVVEPLAGSMPRIGQHVGPLLPFGNAFTFTKTPWLHAYPMWWGPLGALLYFTGVVAVVFLAALLVINRRDP
jgi:hypothetical protein